MILQINLEVNMKLICIKNIFDETNTGLYINDPLEVGKIYDVVPSSNFYDRRKMVGIYLDTNNGTILEYPKDWFITQQQHRENIINKIVNNE